MKFLIIGKYDEKLTKQSVNGFRKTCNDIGKYIAKQQGELVICSMYEKSADFYVYQGYLSSKSDLNKKVVNIFTVEQIKRDTRLKWNIHNYSFDNTKLSQVNRYLLCQLEALEECDIVIAIGGEVSGSSEILLKIAETKKKGVFPIPNYGGSAADFFNRNRYTLFDYMREDISDIKESYSVIENLLSVYTEGNLRRKERIRCEECDFRPIYRPRVFISYAKANIGPADYIETLLRRRNIPVFRDETDFKAGEDLNKSIMNEINKSNIFIAVWCKEYACSPWCYDEIELALQLKQKGLINIWIICVDDTRMVPVKARNMRTFPGKNRYEIESSILTLLSNIEN